MPYITIDREKDMDVKLSYADYGVGKPVVLIHGWPLSHRMWEKQIGALVSAGCRVIAYDRRGFGESYKPWDGYDYDSFTADLAKLMDRLDLQDATLVGFSMGGGEVARYLSKYGSDRVSKAAFISSVTPYMLKTEDNPDGVDQSVFDGMIEKLQKDRPAFLEGFGKDFVNWDTDGRDLLSEASLRHSWDIAVWASPKATLDCVKAFSETDFRDDLKAITIPTLVIHGDADRIVPFEVSGQRAHQMLKTSQLKVIPGGAHGLTYTHPDEINSLLIDFIS